MERICRFPLAIVFVVYSALAKDSPDRPPSKSFAEYLGVLKNGDAWSWPRG